jgi:uncharacterized tellurite resistance protein B-like protein
MAQNPMDVIRQKRFALLNELAELKVIDVCKDCGEVHVSKRYRDVLEIKK